MDRKEIAHILEECGTLLELKGENPFRCNAYRNAARAVLQIEGDIAEQVASGKLAKVKGIGDAMGKKIIEYVETGRIVFHDELVAEIPSGLVDMLSISGFGPKRIHQVYTELGIDTIEKLKTGIEDGRILELKGFGDKLGKKILEGIAFLDKTGKRVLLPVAMEVANELRSWIEGHPAVQRMEVCGSLRRQRETIADVDLLVSSDDPAPIMQKFIEHPGVAAILGQGPTKSSVLFKSGVQADLRVVSDQQFPFALHYFTGSKEHNVVMRARAQSYGLKLNEYELAGEGKSVECKNEADIFRALDLDYIPPELREDTGEIDAAAKHLLPALIERSDITGVFHCHTNASDGGATLKEMAEAAKTNGLTYLGLADHSQSAVYARGLEPHRVKEQWKQIDAYNANSKDFHLFKGIESDILADGSLDYDEEMLEQFDYVVASVHLPMNMTEPQMTERVIRAIRNPYCTMLGHGTGRLLLQRESYPIDMEAVLKEAAKNRVMVEINANPRRLDIDWLFAKRAKALGVMVVINPDAHSTQGIADVDFGVMVARRGWLSKENVFNTLPLKEVKQRLEERKKK